MEFQNFNLLDFKYTVEPPSEKADGYLDWTKEIKHGIPKYNPGESLKDILDEVSFMNIEEQCRNVPIDPHIPNCQEKLGCHTLITQKGQNFPPNRSTVRFLPS
jgi:hypothetical protein